MDKIREKLVELIENGVPCPDGRDPFGEYCDTCQYSESSDCANERLADYLISHGVTVQEWIPVTEKLPKDGERVLISIGTKGCKHRWSMVDVFKDGDWVLFPTKHVTHWLPLPTPPKGE